MATVRVAPAPAFGGAIAVPPDKSITHRAIMLGGISDRDVIVERPLDSADTGATLQAVEDCGVSVSGHLGERLLIAGAGLRGLRVPPRIDCANAGTLMRLFSGILAGQAFGEVVLDGDESLRARPMSRIARPLTAMGARIHTAPGGTPPVRMEGGGVLRAPRAPIDVASAQVKSCVLLAGLFADGETVVREEHPSRDHTERMLAAAGVVVRVEGGTIAIVGPVAGLALPDLIVPGDFSSAAFHLVAGALCANPQVRLNGVNLNPRRTGLLAVMERMGASVEIFDGPAMAGEATGDLVVRRAGELRATEIEPAEIPGLIDELPLVALLGAFADGATRVRGAADLRAKETDRIAMVGRTLTALGVRVDEHDDGFTVHGAGHIRGGEVDSGGDHRFAMLGAVAGLASDEGVVVRGFEAAAVSYPGFGRDLAALGAVA